MANRIVWVDIPVRDLERAIAFYSAVLGAAVLRQAGPGFFHGLLPAEDGGVGGRLVRAGPDTPPGRTGPVVYLAVEGSLARAVREATGRGGELLQDIQPVGSHGWCALLLDCEGNRIALHAPANN